LPHTMWPLNSPDLNPVDNSIWSRMEQRVYIKLEFRTLTNFWSVS